VNTFRLVLRGLAHYWRTHLPVTAGVATAVAVLAGALAVGDSVRGSLKDLLSEQLGRTDAVVLSSGFLRETLADDIRADASFSPRFSSIAPLIVVQGLVTAQASGRRASRVAVYGVDDRFWQFHGVTRLRGPATDQAVLSPALASAIGIVAGASVLVRVERPSAIPLESLHARKEDPGRTLRLTVQGIAASSDMGEFSLRPQQARVLAVFVPLGQLQRALDIPLRVNVLLVSSVPVSNEKMDARRAPALNQLVRAHALPEDLGVTVRALEDESGVAIESAAGLLDRTRAAAVERVAADAGVSTRPVFSYLVNTLRSGDRSIPYSLVTAIDLGSVAPDLLIDLSGPSPIVLNDWAARDLHVGVGAPVTLEFSVWEEPGQLASRTADFRVAALVPIAGLAADRQLAPVYPGITESARLGDWDPPFPIDLRRVRPADEDYWNRYRTTPKAFIPFEVGAKLWSSKYGDRTSVRVAEVGGRSLLDLRDRVTTGLRSALDPLAAGVTVVDLRAEGLGASQGATDFGEYFTYFSLFLVLSALLLAMLFFRLGVEQRVREVGLLRAVGFTTRDVRRLFTAEGLLLAVVGSVVGALGAIAYAALLVAGLRTWWSGAVGTTGITLHVSPRSLAIGAIATIATAVGCIRWTLRGLARISERSLLSGNVAVDALVAPATLAVPTRDSRGREAPPRAVPASPARRAGLAFGTLGSALVAASMSHVIEPAAGFFGAGAALLVACLCLIGHHLRRRDRPLIEGQGWWAMTRLGARSVSNRPGRSVLAVGVIASATFVLVSVAAFRREPPSASDRHSGLGGYPLLVNLLLPLTHDPNGSEAREALGIASIKEVSIEPFRVLPGDDTSCLNLYEPRNPRVLGASQHFIDEGRFRFDGSLASNDAERANPWRLLNRVFADSGPSRVIPVVGDANSTTYVLHKKLGEDIVIHRGDGDVRLRLVATLSDSVFQSELVMSSANFEQLFPSEAGYRFLLVDTPERQAAEVLTAIASSAGDVGADAVATLQRLEEFHRVENTYLSTFQALGGLGVIVGTLGLSAVLMRNVLERRRELALLGAVGFRRADVFLIVLAEHVLLLGWGLGVGSLCALVAVAPVLFGRVAVWSVISSSGSLLAVVLCAGLLSSAIATRAALGTDLLGALRSE
jgi:ABC-type lipoprotein release transport system permease subunit